MTSLRLLSGAAALALLGVTITDEDPGSVPHFEAIVAGRPGPDGFMFHALGMTLITQGLFLSLVLAQP